MPKHYCIFLRGVNTGGVRMKMEDLKKAFASMSFPDAKTILATGNIIVHADRLDRAALKAAVEKGLGSYFKYEASVFVRDESELEGVLSAAAGLSVPPDCHLYYLICDDSAVPRELERLFGSLEHRAGEAVKVLDGGAFWIVPAGETLSSPFGSKILGAKKYRDSLTSRNINTVEKALHAMRACG